jgi:hypothetical protein
MKRCGSATNEESRPPALPWCRGEVTLPLAQECLPAATLAAMSEVSYEGPLSADPTIRRRHAGMKLKGRIFRSAVRAGTAANGASLPFLLAPAEVG